MTIPRYDEIQRPILDLLSDNIPRRSKDMEPLLAKVFSLSEEEVEQEYDSKNAKVFIDRINWALSYLNMAGVVTKPKRGIYQINDSGRKLLTMNDEGFREYINKKIETREQPKKTPKSSPVVQGTVVSADATPEESLYESFQGIRQSVYREILDTILSKSPREFEKLVVMLLQKMGYGDKIDDSGLVTQYVNDKGIDGIVKEDVLGFGRIHIQAKRYALDHNIPREDIQKFVGALAGQSDKGVFITTSDFTKGACEYAKTLGSQAKVVLINGQKLAEYIYDYNVGMQTEKIIEIKKLDGDFWDGMQEE